MPAILTGGKAHKAIELLEKQPVFMLKIDDINSGMSVFNTVSEDGPRRMHNYQLQSSGV